MLKNYGLVYKKNTEKDTEAGSQLTFCFQSIEQFFHVILLVDTIII
ncbi:hypothetical protein IPH67_05395 [bacterium]|nr:MAG: hypothetical protein IPH67_05395 [bacterium]